MFCKYCGKQIPDEAKFCPECGARFDEAAAGESDSPASGTSYQGTPASGTPGGNYTFTPDPNYRPREETTAKSSRSKLCAGLLGIFLGAFGVHNFYLGKTGRAVAQIIVTLVTCGAGGIWGFIEGILCLCGNYTDADGLPLSD